MKKRHEQVLAAIEACKTSEAHAAKTVAALIAHTEADGIRDASTNEQRSPMASDAEAERTGMFDPPVLQQITTA